MYKEKVLATGAIILLIVSVITTGLYYNSNKSLIKNLNDEKLKTEIMLSEKLALQKEIESFKNQINSLSGQNADLDKLLAETSQKLSGKEAQLNKIVRENGNIKSLKNQLADLTQMKKDFESQVLALNETIQKLNTEKNTMNRTIASLQDENKQLAANLDISSKMADNYLVETKKRNERLTVVAKRAKKMTVTFNVPENIVENISFKLIKPDGTKVDGKGNGIAYRVINTDEGLLASLSAAGEIKVSKKIEMIWEPKKKQKPGIYKIEMYNGDKYIGACNVKLR